MSNDPLDYNEPEATVTPLPIVFTAEDRRMLTEMHAAITDLHKMLAETLPNLGKSPIGRMLGLG